MEFYYLMNVSFPGVSFDAWEPGSKKTDLSHVARLYTRKTEIELQVYFDASTRFDRKFAEWLGKINWAQFGSLIQISNESQNQGLQRIDLSAASLVGASFGRDDSNDVHTFSIKLNSVKLYRDPNTEKPNTAEFYLDDSGFKLVSGFYSILWELDEGFKIQRMTDSEDFYKLAKSEFRPEFDFSTQDDKSASTATITKHPKIQFRFSDTVTEQQAWLYGDIVRLLGSFFFRTNLTYSRSIVYLPESTVVVKTINNATVNTHDGGLSQFGLGGSFSKFLKTNWQAETQSNYEKLSTAIRLFNQSIITDGSTTFLIRFNIIEVCMKGMTQDDKERFNQILSSSNVSDKYDQALNILLETVSAEDHEMFKKKWIGVKDKMQFKPMKSPMEEFLRDQKFQLNEFPIPFNKLKSIRDSLTHGSINSVSSEELRKANILLYGVAGILILNLIGPYDCKLFTDIK